MTQAPRGMFSGLRPFMLAVCAAVIAGCASAPESNANLEQARAAFESARNDAAAAQTAPVVLDKAQSELERADRLLEDGADAELVDHHAYLAQRYSEIAVARGRTAAAEREIADAEARRQEILLEARTREAREAELRAESRELEAAEALRAAEQSARKAETAEARTAQLQAELQALEAKPTDRGMVLTLSDVLFDTAEAELKAGSDRALEELIRFMKEYPDRNLMIEGFTDSRGASEFNQDLSERRADAVESVLIDAGIDQTRIRSRGYGESFPVASNDTATGRQLNRRVEVVISDTDGTIPERMAGPAS